MAVEVLEAAAIHEAIVLRRAGIGLAARRACSLDNRIDLRAAVARQAEQRLDETEVGGGTTITFVPLSASPIFSPTRYSEP